MCMYKYISDNMTHNQFIKDRLYLFECLDWFKVGQKFFTEIPLYIYVERSKNKTTKSQPK